MPASRCGISKQVTEVHQVLTAEGKRKQVLRGRGKRDGTKGPHVQVLLQPLSKSVSHDPPTTATAAAVAGSTSLRDRSATLNQRLLQAELEAGHPNPPSFLVALPRHAMLIHPAPCIPPL